MTTALAERNGAAGFTSEQLDLIKRTVAKDASDDELSLFLYTASSRGLDPLLKQIHAVSRYDKKQNRKVMSIQVGIDGYRLIAARTGDYAGNDDVQFSEQVPGAPNSASATVYRFVQGMRCPFTATARWDEYCPTDGGDFMWKKMPYTMLGKCAEALALRKAFPAEMSGLYVDEEMQQAGPAAESAPQIVVQEQPKAQPVAVTKPNTEGTGPLIHERDPLWKGYSDLAAEASRFRLAIPNIVLPIRQSELVKHGKALREAVNARKDDLAAQQTAIYGTEEQSFADLPAHPSLGRDARPPEAAPTASEPADTRSKSKGKRNTMTESDAAYQAAVAVAAPMVQGVEHPLYQKLSALFERAAELDIDMTPYMIEPPAPEATYAAAIAGIESDIQKVEQSEGELSNPVELAPAF